MLLIIIFISIFVILVGLTILFAVLDEKTCEDFSDMKFGFLLLACFFLLPAAGTSIAAGVCQSDYKYDCAKAEYNLRVEQLNSTYDSLSKAITTGSDSYYVTMNLAEYNEQVKDFKLLIVEGQRDRANPWISVFTSKAYDEMDVNSVRYL